jgi:S-adenosylmethionine hydrolase
MQIVTLTTDFGHKDYYQGLLKGAILSKTPTVQLVDISHDIESYDIVHGAFVLKNAFSAFPKGTIHLIIVTNSTERRQKFLAFEYKGHYFLGPDNGLFSLILEKLPKEVYRLPFSRRGSFPLKDLFAKAIEHVAAGNRSSI